MGAGRGRRTGLILIVVIILLLVGGVGILLVSAFLTPPATGGGGAQGSEVAPTPITTVKLIVAKRDIRRGSRLTQDDVTTADWPSDLTLPANAMLAGDSVEQPGLEQVEDTVARVDILKDQPVLSHMITAPGQADLQASGSDAALLIPTGQVAVAFPLSRLSSVAYALRTGDHVDVLMSYRFVSVDQDFQTLLPNNVGAVASLVLPGGETQTPAILIAGREENGPFGTQIMVVPAEQAQRPRQVTQLVIKNAIVLRVGEWPLGDVNDSIVVTPPPEPAEGATPVPEGESTGPTPVPVVIPDVITLVMSRQDALVLKYSLETGSDIDFALRSALDNDVTDVSTDSVTLQYLMDFYDIVEPPRLPIAQDPRIDAVTDPNGNFPSSSGGGVAAPPPPE